MEMSKREFWKTMTEKEVKSKIGGGIAAGYISSAATLIFAIAFYKNPLLAAEGLLVLLLTLGLQILRSRSCAVLLLTLYTVGQALTFIPSVMVGDIPNVGRIGMIVFFIGAYASAIKGTFEFQKNWKMYLKGEYTYTAHSSETKNLSDYANIQTVEESEQ